jgi:hypothetical protein
LELQPYWVSDQAFPLTVRRLNAVRLLRVT